jgi:hypothetical protein
MKYILPGRQIPSMLVAYSSDRAVRANEIERYTDSIIRYAGQKGLSLPRPDYENIDINHMDEAMAAMNKTGKPPRLILYFDSKRNKSHDLLKLLERRHQVPKLHYPLLRILDNILHTPSDPHPAALHRDTEQA